MNLEQLQTYLGLDSTSAPKAEAQSAVTPRAAAGANCVMERLQEIQLAQKLGYLICKCSWPPTVMTLSTSDFIYRCPRCSRVRDF